MLLATHEHYVDYCVPICEPQNLYHHEINFIMLITPFARFRICDNCQKAQAGT